MKFELCSFEMQLTFFRVKVVMSHFAGSGSQVQRKEWIQKADVSEHKRIVLSINQA